MVGSNIRGTVDVFEEIPAILVVIVASFLFLMSVTEAFISYSARKEYDQLDDHLDSFSESILSFEPLLAGIGPGRFDFHALGNIGRAKVSASFQPQSLGFHYNLTLVDASLYEERYDWYAGAERVEHELERTTSIPVVVSNSFDQHHSAILRVTIWV